MNMKQVWGISGGFFVAYLVISLTNKPQVGPDASRQAPPAQEPTAYSSVQTTTTSTSTGFQKGFCYPGLGASSLNDGASDQALAALAATGAQWVAITPVLVQASAAADEVTVDPVDTPTMEALGHAIDQAHGLGLKVMLRPVVASRDGARREAFAPVEPSAWFTSYARLIDSYLDLAASRQVALVCLGSSYSRLEQSAPWSDYIRRARTRYSGQLTYGASWRDDGGHGGFRQVPFWSELDYVGVDAVLDGASDAEEQVAQVASAIESWLSSQGGARPVLLTSFGSSGSDEAQRRAYEAFFQGVYPRPWLAGSYAYYWRNPAAGELTSPFTVEGRPALDVVKLAFAQPR